MLSFSLFFLLEAVGEFVEHAAVSQGVSCPDAPQSSSKLWIVQGPSSFSLTVSLLDPACLFLLEILNICS